MAVVSDLNSTGQLDGNAVVHVIPIAGALRSNVAGAWGSRKGSGINLAFLHQNGLF